MEVTNPPYFGTTCSTRVEPGTLDEDTGRGRPKVSVEAGPGGFRSPGSWVRGLPVWLRNQSGKLPAQLRTGPGNGRLKPDLCTCQMNELIIIALNPFARRRRGTCVRRVASNSMKGMNCVITILLYTFALRRRCTYPQEGCLQR